MSGTCSKNMLLHSLSVSACSAKRRSLGHKPHCQNSVGTPSAIAEAMSAVHATFVATAPAGAAATSEIVPAVVAAASVFGDAASPLMKQPRYPLVQLGQLLEQLQQLLKQLQRLLKHVWQLRELLQQLHDRSRLVVSVASADAEARSSMNSCGSCSSRCASTQQLLKQLQQLVQQLQQNMLLFQHLLKLLHSSAFWVQPRRFRRVSRDRYSTHSVAQWRMWTPPLLDAAEPEFAVLAPGFTSTPSRYRPGVPPPLGLRASLPHPRALTS